MSTPAISICRGAGLQVASKIEGENMCGQVQERDINLKLVKSGYEIKFVVNSTLNAYPCKFVK